MVAARFTPHGKVFRIFERQSIGGQTHMALRSLDDVIWTFPFSDVVEVLAQVPRGADRLRLYHHLRDV